MSALPEDRLTFWDSLGSVGGVEQDVECHVDVEVFAAPFALSVVGCALVGRDRGAVAGRDGWARTDPTPTGIV